MFEMRENLSILVTTTKKAYLNVSFDFVENVFACQCNLLVQPSLILGYYLTKFIVGGRIG